MYRGNEREDNLSVGAGEPPPAHPRDPPHRSALVEARSSTSTASSTGDDDEERCELMSGAVMLYHDRRYYLRETETTVVKDWSVGQVVRWIESAMRRADSVPRYYELVDRPSKFADLIRKLLRLIEQEEMDGGLLIAGGKSYLTEKASGILSSKRDRMRLQFAVLIVFAALDEARELRGSIPYWVRVERFGGAAGVALCRQFAAPREGVALQLRAALRPHPLDVICYTSLCHLEVAEVMKADLYVAKEVPNEDVHCMFKVVSVAPRDDPTVASTNLIYVRRDVGDMLEKQHSSADVEASSANADTAAPREKGRQRRKRQQKRERERRWELVASVDFAQHGAALPGHWHLNRTTSGDVIPHLSLDCSGFGGDVDDDEERGGGEQVVWHGREDSCPLWWQFIPEEMSYKEMPPRLQQILRDVTIH